MSKLNIGSVSELAARVEKLEKDPIRNAPTKQIREIEKRHIVAIDPGYYKEVDDLDLTDLTMECECVYKLSSNGILTIDAALNNETDVTYTCYLTGASSESEVCKHIDKTKVTTIIITDRVQPGTKLDYALAGFTNCTRIIFPADDWIDADDTTTSINFLFKDDSSLTEVLGTNLTEWVLPDDCTSVNIFSGCDAYETGDDYTVAYSYWGVGGTTSSVTYLYQTDEATFDSCDYDGYDYDAMLKGWIKFASDIEIEDGTECTISGTIVVNDTEDFLDFVFGFVNANSNCENAIIDTTIDTTTEATTLVVNQTFTYKNSNNETFFGFGFRQDESNAKSDVVTIKDFYIAVNS